MTLTDGEIVLRRRTEDDVPGDYRGVSGSGDCSLHACPVAYTEDDAREFLLPGDLA
ncbi:MAG: hypothetical protein ACRDOP_14705 [Gaiellaceae bacterium]